MLKYALVESGIANEQNGCTAVVSSPEVKGLNDVIDFMISEGTGLTRPQALAYFEKLTQTIEYFVGQGHRVVTPLIRVKPTISGVFSDKKDSFDSSRHQINIRTTSGLRLRELSTKIKLEKVDVSSQIPVPQLFIDGSSQEVNTSASPGGIGVLKGSLMKFDSSDAAQGVFFISEDDSTNIVRVNAYSGIKPSEIHFQIPLLSSGSYTIVVRTRTKNGNFIQKGELKQTINV